MFLLPQISQIYTDFRPVRSLFLGIILFSHRFHRFTQIFFDSHGLPIDAQPKTEGLKSV